MTSQEDKIYNIDSISKDLSMVFSIDPDILKSIVKEIFVNIAGAVSEGKTVTIQNFGKFTPCSREKPVYYFKTKQTGRIKYNTLVYKPASNISRLLNV